MGVDRLDEVRGNMWRSWALGSLALAVVALAAETARRSHVSEEHPALGVLLGADFTVPVVEFMPVADAERALGNTPWVRWDGCRADLERIEYYSPYSGGYPARSDHYCFIGPVAWQCSSGNLQYCRGFPSLNGPLSCVRIDRHDEPSPGQPGSYSVVERRTAHFEYRISQDRHVAEYRCVPIDGNRDASSSGVVAVRIRWARAKKPVPVGRWPFPGRPLDAFLPTAVLPERPTPPARHPLKAIVPAVLLVAAVVSACRRGAVARDDLTRPWVPAVRVSDDRAQLNDGRFVAFDPARCGVRPGAEALLLIVEERPDARYRDGDLLRATDVREDTLEPLRGAPHDRVVRRWRTTAILAWSSALAVVVARVFWG